jgi:hypothetical protein
MLPNATLDNIFTIGRRSEIANGSDMRPVICGLLCEQCKVALKHAKGVRTYAVGVLSLRQSDTLLFYHVRFFHAQRGKTAHRRIGKYHAAAGKNVASGTLWVPQNSATA